MISFNTLLREQGIDPSVVKLVRHQQTNSRNGLTPYKLWLAADGQLDLYQRIQHKLVYRNAEMLATFVATPLNETLFVGMFAVNGVGKTPRGLKDPIWGPISSRYLYDLTATSGLAEYSGRLMVDWGSGYRSWIQLAAKREKSITEIRQTVREQEFPGFPDFSWRLRDFASVPITWRGILAAVSGIYLFVDLGTH